MFSYFAKNFRNRSGDAASGDGVSKDAFAGREFGVGGDTVAVSRTPQKGETFNNLTLNGNKKFDRKPQHLLKKDQQQSLLQGDVYHPDRKKELRHDVTKAPVVNPVLKNGVNEVTRLIDLQEKRGEIDRTDQKEFSKRNQFENTSNGYKRQDDPEIQMKRLQTDWQGTDFKKSLALQENVGVVDRTVQMISSDYKESVNRDSVKKKPEKSTKLVQDNQMMNQSDGVSLNRIESRASYKE